MKTQRSILKIENRMKAFRSMQSAFGSHQFLVPIFCLILATVGCKPDPDIIYNVNDVEVVRPTGNKGYQKSLTEFISIAFADVFDQNITQEILLALSTPYAGFGDLKYVEDLIIRNFLNNSAAQLPSDIEMRSNVNAFITDTYQRFFNRNPNEFELWHMQNLIEENADITPELVYYSIMTSDEYRYY